MDKVITNAGKRITAQVLNGATGEIREVVANVAESSEQAAVDTLFANARKDDYYYRFLGHASVIEPSTMAKTPVLYSEQTYWAAE